MTPLESVVSVNPATGQSSASQYAAVRKQTEALAAPLTAEDQMVQSCADASPTKWHLAHTSWFFETFILAHHLHGYRPFDERFQSLFNSYYNSLGPQPDKALRNTFSRPTLDDVMAYRHHVDEHIEDILGADAPETLVKLVEMGANHEQQHQELIVTDIKHAFWTSPLRPIYQNSFSTVAGSASSVTPQKQHTYAEGMHEIGSGPGRFHFDNEAPRHKAFLPAFRLATRLVTCGEYLSFMEDRGYTRPELWLSDGWKAVQTHGWTAPLYWEKHSDEWRQFTCSGMRKVEQHEPVCHVSFYEADAFARWAGARLPTEFEWEIAASQINPEGNLLEAGRFHPRAAQPQEANQPLQMFGDVWEWTASAYLPYPGYKPAAGALGEYNGKFMSNQMVLRGGSCITPRSHIRATYRNFFPPETRWQFSGIRLTDDGN